MSVLGAHMTTAKGFDKAVENAKSINANAMQVFTRNPRGGCARIIKDAEIERLKALCNNDFEIIAHAPYTVNLASSKADVRDFGVRTIIEDLSRIELLGAKKLVVHSGAHTGAGKEKGLARLIESLEKILPRVSEGSSVLLETMSGQGTELGTSIEELEGVLKYFNMPQSLGICLDSCHLFAAGYDVRDWQGFKATFSAHLPWEVVGCLHLNDSKMPLFSHKDRHEKLGRGCIGWEGVLGIVLAEKDNRFPIIMETPNELSGWADEIARLKEALTQ